MSPRVHDNVLYAEVVDYGARRIFLHTYYPHTEPPEYTDVVFEEVETHYFEQQGFGPKQPQNILFDVTEADPAFVLDGYDELLERTKNYGWPVLEYHDRDDLIRRLTADGVKCFRVHGTCGLEGFVFAKSMTLRLRATRAEVGA